MEHMYMCINFTFSCMPRLRVNNALDFHWAYRFHGIKIDDGKVYLFPKKMDKPKFL